MVSTRAPGAGVSTRPRPKADIRRSGHRLTGCKIVLLHPDLPIPGPRWALSSPTHHVMRIFVITLSYRSAIPGLDPSQIRTDFQRDARLANDPERRISVSQGSNVSR